MNENGRKKSGKERDRKMGTYFFFEENPRCDNLNSNIHAVCDRLKL